MHFFRSGSIRGSRFDQCFAVVQHLEEYICCMILHTRSFQGSSFDSFLHAFAHMGQPLQCIFFVGRSIRGNSFNVFAAVAELPWDQLRCLFLRVWSFRASSFNAFLCRRGASGGSASMHFLRTCRGSFWDHLGQHRLCTFTCFCAQGAASLNFCVLLHPGGSIFLAVFAV